ncbi:MAG: restriction endonuclease subunit S [Cyclobacteriaceae bacterium]|jgi:type I restriction enzyme S subunit
MPANTPPEKQPNAKPQAVATPDQNRTNSAITPVAQNSEGLADGWKWVKLGEACNVLMGQSPPSTSYNTDGIGVPFFQGKAEFTDLHPVVEKWCSSPNKIAEPNDILLSVRAPVGTTNIADQKCCIGRGLAAIRFPNYKYAFYFLRSIEQQLDKKGTGTTFRAISGETIRETLFPLASETDQHAIVSKIEELLSELDKGKQQLEIAQQQLKIYRQAVLKWAFEGKLTNENVKEGELPVGWKMVELGKVCEKIQDGSHFSPQVQYMEPGTNRYMYITAKNIRNNYMDMTKLIYVDKDFHDSIYNRCNPEFGDVLLTKDGVNTGEVTLNTIREPFSLLSSVCIFKTKKQELKSEFLKYFIQSPFGSKLIDSSMTGTAIKRIVLRKIRDAKIILPPIDEQRLIIQEIESRLSVCDKVEETITTSLAQAETLRQSILKKAFEGKLV